MTRKARVLGSFELPPRLPMSEAVQLAKIIAERFKSGEFTDEALASALGHGAAKSGAFRQKVADLRKYGVVDGRGATLRASASALALYADHPGDTERAAKEMLQNVPIFKAMFEQFGAKVPDDQTLVPALLNLTKAPRPEVEQNAGMLRDLYRDACGTIPAMPSGAGSSNGGSPSTLGGLGASTGSGAGAGDRFASRTAEYEFSVADDPDTIESVIEQLQARKRSLERHKPVAGPGGTRAST